MILPPSFVTPDNANKRHASRFLHGSLTLLIEAALGKHFKFIDIPVPTPRPRSASALAPLLANSSFIHPHLRCAALAAKVKHASYSPIIVLSHIASRAAHLAFFLKAVKSRNTTERAGREQEEESAAAEPRSRLGALFSRGEMSALAVHARQDGK